jgi:hypothetical protein
MRRPRSITFSVARSTAEPPTPMAPDPPFPRPAPRRSLSPQKILIRSGGTPVRSLTICVKAVSFPCPMEVVPAKTEMEPSAFTRS